MTSGVVSVNQPGEALRKHLGDAIETDGGYRVR
jgi:hypothetical protein